MHDAIAATWGWDEAWQRAHFAEHIAPERIALIVHEGEAVGMLELQDRTDDYYVANLKLLPEAQGRGLGTAVMRQVLAEAAKRGLPVRLQVLEANTGARRLYERLGFVATGVVPPHVLMEHAGTCAET
jgi:ribosomal protein S18 acetylase RimI-like enzyme